MPSDSSLGVGLLCRQVSLRGRDPFHFAQGRPSTPPRLRFATSWLRSGWQWSDGVRGAVAGGGRITWPIPNDRLYI